MFLYNLLKYYLKDVEWIAFVLPSGRGDHQSIYKVMFSILKFEQAKYTLEYFISLRILKR